MGEDDKVMACHGRWRPTDAWLWVVAAKLWLVVDCHGWSHNLVMPVDHADFMKYVVDNTLYVHSENIDITLELKTLSGWFPNNFLKTNAEKCHLILS